MKRAALFLPCFLVACQMTPEDHQRVAQSMHQAGANMSAADARGYYDNQQASQNTVNYLQQRQQSQPVNYFQQQADQRRLQNQLDQIERNTDPYRAF